MTQGKNVCREKNKTKQNKQTKNIQKETQGCFLAYSVYSEIGTIEYREKHPVRNIKDSFKINYIKHCCTVA